jgi:hypothetical protein
MTETVKKTKAPAKPRSSAAKTKAVTEEVAAPAKLQAVPAKAKPVEEKTAVVAPTREQIAQLAHRFWAERGRQHGSAEQDWLRAEQELRGKAS